MKLIIHYTIMHYYSPAAIIDDGDLWDEVNDQTAPYRRNDYLFRRSYRRMVYMAASKIGGW